MDFIIMPAGGLLMLLVALIALMSFFSDPYQVDREEKKAVEREYA